MGTNCLRTELTIENLLQNQNGKLQEVILKKLTIIGNCCTTPTLGRKTQNSINKNLFKRNFKEVFFYLKP